MAYNDLVNSVSCGAGNANTGLAGCSFDWKRITTIELSPKSYKYLSGSTQLDTILAEQQKGNIIILQNVVSFVDAKVAPTVITREGSGLKVIAGELPYEYTATWDNGVNFWKALRKLNSNGLYNIALYDVNGSKIFMQTKNGEFKGFGLGMFFADKYVGSDGTTSSQQSAQLQIMNVMDVDAQAWLTADNLDYAPSELDGINDVTFTILPTLSGATALTFSALLIDKTSFFEGLTIPNIKVSKNGIGLVPSAISGDATTKTYTLTIPAAVTGDVYKVFTYDSVLHTQPINVGNYLYESNIASVTV